MWADTIPKETWKLAYSELRMPWIASHKVPRLHYQRTKAEMKKV